MHAPFESVISNPPGYRLRYELPLMLNRPTNVFSETPRKPGAAERLWRTDERPGIRLTWLFVLIVLPFVGVSARLAQLQVDLPDAFIRGFDRTIVTYEPIPSFDGRILAEDGRKLAYDVERFRVSMHYRWLEEPADSNWLRSEALSRLNREQRRDGALVDAEMKKVLDRRKAMWFRLAKLTGTPPERLDTTRNEIQRRIERIVSLVDRNQAARRSERSALPGDSAGSADAPAWKRVWHTIVTTLTTPPARIVDDPIVVKEELSYHPVIDDVPLDVRAHIEAHPEQFPGLRVEMTTIRLFPDGSLAPHVRGVRTPMTPEDYERRKTEFADGDPLDYQIGDRIGRNGLERTYDSLLRGLRGKRRIIRDRRGQVIRTETVRMPVNGRDLEITLHLPLQRDMQSLIDGILEKKAGGENPERARAGACLVAIDVYTGALLVAATAPRYDLNLFVNADEQSWQQVADDPRKPFIDRTIRMALPPGSVFKALTSLAVLDSRAVDPDEEFYCQGYLDRPDRYRCYVYQHYGRGHGEVNLSDAICQSCNVYFFSAARKMKAAPIIEWARRFEFGRPTGIDLPGERSGHLPAAGRTGSGGAPGSRKQPWYPGDTLGLAIGQSRLTVTPLQIARMMAAIANGGYLVTPYATRPAGPRFIGGDEYDLRPDRNPRRIAGLSPAMLQRVREGLERVVADRRGTGYKTVRLEEISIAGKTGTAEVGAGRPDHAWFAGYVPADQPRFAFAVVLEYAGPGGREAGPVARQLVQAMLKHGLLEPTQLSSRE